MNLIWKYLGFFFGITKESSLFYVIPLFILECHCMIEFWSWITSFTWSFSTKYLFMIFKKSPCNLEYLCALNILKFSSWKWLYLVHGWNLFVFWFNIFAKFGEFLAENHYANNVFFSKVFRITWNNKSSPQHSFCYIGTAFV